MSKRHLCSARLWLQEHGLSYSLISCVHLEYTFKYMPQAWIISVATVVRQEKVQVCVSEITSPQNESFSATNHTPDPRSSVIMLGLTPSLLEEQPFNSQHWRSFPWKPDINSSWHRLHTQWHFLKEQLVHNQCTKTFQQLPFSAENKDFKIQNGGSSIKIF